MRLIFMGTPVFAGCLLDHLIAEGHSIIAVYTQPPRPAGRGMRLTPSAVQKSAETYNIPVFTPLSLKKPEAQEQFRSHEADLAIVAAYGLLLPKIILDSPRLGCINIHTSLLPRWRGAAPIQRSIMAGDTQTGVTIMQMNEGLDEGDILSSQTIPIDHETTSGILHDRLIEISKTLLDQTLKAFANNAAIPTPQPATGITYAHKITNDECMINWSNDAEHVIRHIHGLSPWHGAYFDHQGEKFKVFKARFVPISHNAASGTILDRQKLLFACGKNAIEILEIQRSGKKALSREDFIKGFTFE